jgi:hypothetical protein
MPTSVIGALETQKTVARIEGREPAQIAGPAKEGELF